ncbi:ABC transporter substrate-binding protein [Variovorax sp. OV329]|uniref:ABC transporter substrate-binding protein n=1 Tax=Variovorax sp. OV329 TaxID=1882825 RepID=UPI0008E6CACA|nr:ABC transporter substrate-binding protein [Variovorax sp. OV329]SFN43031.1 amino acid/amide ABC transporter substrate-binding protein, HAAT family [Variovorax sp. OV329]
MKSILATLGLALALPAALAQPQGVTKNEIVVGTIQDLSGPAAGLGKQARFGMQMRVDEINEQGGIHGRKIRLLVEDSAYDPRKAVLAAQKLVNQDGIFVMAGHFGTAGNVAVMPLLLEKNIVNFMPLTGAREMYEPAHKLKYAMQQSYYDQLSVVVPKLVKEKQAKQVCTMYQDDDAGLEMFRGAEAGLKSIGMQFAEKTTYKRGATDFSSQVARMKAANCDFVVLGTIIRETVGAMAEARKNDFNPTFLASVAAYSDLIPKLGGKAVDGLYAGMASQNPYVDDSSPALRAWATKYQASYHEDPAVTSAYGYIAMDLFVKGAQKAGPDLSTETLVKAMDSLSVPPDIFGTDTLSFSPTKRLGSDSARLSQLQDGRWKVVSDYVKPAR